jgi:hypothetical protein
MKLGKKRNDKYINVFFFDFNFFLGDNSKKKEVGDKEIKAIKKMDCYYPNNDENKNLEIENDENDITITNCTSTLVLETTTEKNEGKKDLELKNDDENIIYLENEIKKLIDNTIQIIRNSIIKDHKKFVIIKIDEQLENQIQKNIDSNDSDFSQCQKVEFLESKFSDTIIPKFYTIFQNNLEFQVSKIKFFTFKIEWSSSLLSLSSEIIDDNTNTTNSLNYYKNLQNDIEILGQKIKEVDLNNSENLFTKWHALYLERMLIENNIKNAINESYKECLNLIKMAIPKQNKFVEYTFFDDDKNQINLTTNQQNIVIERVQEKLVTQKNFEIIDKITTKNIKTKIKISCLPSTKITMSNVNPITIQRVQIKDENVNVNYKIIPQNAEQVSEYMKDLISFAFARVHKEIFKKQFPHLNSIKQEDIDFIDQQINDIFDSINILAQTQIKF